MSGKVAIVGAVGQVSEPAGLLAVVCCHRPLLVAIYYRTMYHMNYQALRA